MFAIFFVFFFYNYFRNNRFLRFRGSLSLLLIKVQKLNLCFIFNISFFRGGLIWIKINFKQLLFFLLVFNFKFFVLIFFWLVKIFTWLFFLRLLLNIWLIVMINIVGLLLFLRFLLCYQIPEKSFLNFRCLSYSLLLWLR